MYSPACDVSSGRNTNLLATLFPCRVVFDRCSHIDFWSIPIPLQVISNPLIKLCVSRERDAVHVRLITSPSASGRSIN